MNVKLPYKFELRDYQIDDWNAVMLESFLRGLLVIPRRNGKDILCWNLLIAKAMQRRALYYYMGPYYNQIRQIIWEGVDGTGRLFLDYIPSELVTSKTKIDMRIKLVNGSQIKLLGSDNIDSIVGTNPYGIVFTEFSLHRPAAWSYLRPILAENGGWALFNGTPRGHNHQYKLDMFARKNPQWHTNFLTRDDTGIPSLKAIQADRESGMPEELIQQEYYCSYASGLVGSYYNDLMKKLEEGDRPQVINVPYESDFPVVTAWDLGMDDSTVIWFIQEINKEIRVIDCYSNHSKGLDHYVNYLFNKPYAYRQHIFPFDINVRELGTGKSRKHTLRTLGLENIIVAPKLSIQDGIAAVRTILLRCWFDQNKCFEGIEALKSYRRNYDDKLDSFSKSPVHDKFSHYADAFRVYATGRRAIMDTTKLPSIADGTNYNPFISFDEREKYTNPYNLDPLGRTAYA